MADGGSGWGGGFGGEGGEGCFFGGRILVWDILKVLKWQRFPG